jgi:hypothetical protein
VLERAGLPVRDNVLMMAEFWCSMRLMIISSPGLLVVQE